MTAAARTQANRRNAQNSTGPRTGAGKHRSSRNSIRHGLAVATLQSSEAVASIEAIVEQIIGDFFDPISTEIAHRIALAHFDTIRARQARHRLCLSPRDPYDLEMDLCRKDNNKVLLGTAPPEVEARWFMAIVRIAEPGYLTAPDLLEDTLVGCAAELRRIERYERRAASRRKKAIRELDAYMRAKNSERREA